MLKMRVWIHSFPLVFLETTQDSVCNHVHFIFFTTAFNYVCPLKHICSEVFYFAFINLFFCTPGIYTEHISSVCVYLFILMCFHVLIWLVKNCSLPI